ncbi:uncharacterized protein LOC111702532 [Eurytemora carolleeae]|uniref:uncharacterized protein LOC111702532 n=1 Tax=Eurytemora carolleeae TaxID=1294199 RepID=UPI000C774F08|nr:uncharacterized protein LOC111702532 [Eurytemora carolleeae]|eukprot:XP_023330027.1 uncharacterized protein LOC111702532 [Eurytemora affinis]
MIEEMISCPWLETPSDIDTESSDDWFYKSISMYKHLLMYNLPVQPEAVVLKAGGDLLALSGPNPRCATKHEISVYRLPSKLLCTSDQDEGLNNSRDFKLVSGSIVRTPIVKLQFNTQGQLISSDGEPNLQIWNMQEAGEDVLGDGGQIKSCLKIVDFYVDHDTACITDGIVMA